MPARRRQIADSLVRRPARHLPRMTHPMPTNYSRCIDGQIIAEEQTMEREMKTASNPLEARRQDGTCESLDFQNKNLSGQDFSGQDLRGACFEGARLVGANFQKTDLRGANFRDARCLSANSDEANLSGTILDNTKFHEACLRGANFGTPY